MLVKENGTNSLPVNGTSRIFLATWYEQFAAGQPACCRDCPPACRLNQITGSDMLEDFLLIATDSDQPPPASL